MKKLTVLSALLIVFAFCLNITIAQDNQTSDYNKKKLSTPYTPDNTAKIPVDPNSSQNILKIAQNTSDSISGLLEPLDATFTIAPFAGATPPFYRNDDLSTGLIAFPTGFEFCLYGTIYTGCYINNNGNITFTGPFGTFTPTGFPIGTAMVAPFWGDVDTRLGASGTPVSGLVYYKFTSGTGTGSGHRLTVLWDKVGYFAVHNEKQNEFEVIITNGLDPLIGIGNNVAFSYVNMAWTTGDASGGSGGFGGAPATVGVNKGTGGIFSTLGRFNQPGTYYGGPSVDTNGVSYLDKLTLPFAVCDATNFCPVPGGFPTNDTVHITCGTTYAHTFTFAAPELGQTVTGGTSALPAGMTALITNGTLSSIDVTWAPNCTSDCGDHVVTFTGTDDFITPCTTTKTVHFIVDCPLPVEMSSFTSLVSGRDVTLNWATSSEQNNARFEIERSTSENNWISAGTVSGNGNSTIAHSYSFTDRALASGTYNYRLKQVDFNGNFEYFNLSNEVNIGTPEKFNLNQNYPNPFNPTTKISYAIPFDGKVSLAIFDNSGKEVQSLVNGVQTAGFYSVNFDGSKLSSGVYYYRVQVSGTSNFVATRKMLLVK